MALPYYWAENKWTNKWFTLTPHLITWNNGK